MIAAVGHTDGDYAATLRRRSGPAPRWPPTCSTRCRRSQHRAPGPVAALLEDERVTVELVNDGTHLHPAVLELAFRAAGAGPGGVHHRRDGRGRHGRRPVPARPDGGGGGRRGGPAGGGRLDRRLDADAGRGVPPGGDRGPAAGAGTWCGPSRPTRPGCSACDDRVGSLEPGKDADLVVLDEAFALVGVMRKGEWLVRRRRVLDRPRRIGTITGGGAVRCAPFGPRQDPRERCAR